jgi:hypothetical protein
MVGSSTLTRPYYDEDEDSGSEEDIVLIHPSHKERESAAT